MATWTQIERRIMARLDALEAQLTEVERKIESVGQDIAELDASIETLSEDAGMQDVRDALPLMQELVEDARRKERLEMLAEARAAMRAS